MRGAAMDNKLFMDQKPRTLSRIIQALPFLLLLPILTIPAGPDQSIYAVSGKMLMQGMTYYTQVGDLKPPFIHFVYGIANALLGDGVFAPRIIDLLAQWITLFFLIKLTRRYVLDNWTPTVAATIYALLYVGLGPDGVGQPESYIGCLLLPAILLVLGESRPMRLVGAGVVSAMLALVKYSMLVCPVLFILLPFLLPSPHTPSWKERGRASLFIAMGAIPPILLAWWYLTYTGASIDFLQANQFLSSRMQLVLQQGGIAARVESLGIWFGYSFGLTMTVLLSLGIWNAIAPSQHSNGNKKGMNIDARFYTCIALFVATLFATTVAELLMFPYQFSRFYAPAALIMAIVICQQRVIQRLVAAWKQGTPSAKLIALFLLIIGGMFSALPHFFLETARGISWRFSSAAVNNPWFDANTPVFHDVCEIGDAIRLRAVANSTDLVAISGFAGYLYCYTGITPKYRQLHGHFLISPFTPTQWKEELVHYIQQHQPQFIAIERNDEASAKFVGATTSTDKAIAAIPMMTQLLQQHYDTLLTRHSIILYQARALSTKH